MQESERKYGRVYLAHPMSGASKRTGETVLEIHRMLEIAGFDVFNPALYDYGWTDEVSYRKIVKRNMQDIANSDVMVAVCTEPSIGLGGELVIARMVTTPVVSYIESERVSAWVRALSWFIVRSRGGVIDKVRNLCNFPTVKNSSAVS